MIAPVTCFAQSAPVTADCELHVWPGAGLNSIYNGWFHGGIVNGAVTGRDGYAAVPSEPINTRAQADLLAKAQLQDLLKQPGYRLVLHPEALPSRTIRSTATRIAPVAGCYAELVVDTVVFQQDWVDGSFLKVLFRYRDFGSDSLPRRSFGAWVKTRLLLLPPKPDTDMAAAAAEVRAAFSNDIALFAAALLKPPKDKKPG